jgi:phosphoribosylanthranilate isomerase
MKIKICGVTNVPDARACADEGADYVGLVFAEISPRRVSVAQAKRIVRALPREVTPVAVVMDQPLDETRAILRETGAPLAQLHGREDPAYAAAVGVPVVKVFDRFTPAELQRLRRYDVFAVMLDLPKTNGAAASVDAGFAAKAKAAAGKVFLSGRLSPESVGGLVRRVRPFAVDACSGTERAPGRKDRRRLRAFIDAARES